MYTGTKEDFSELKNEHTWVCVTYVLDPKLQDGKKLPKWDFRTRQDQYLVKSSKHVSFIGLVRNIHTGFISPKFHVIYDNSLYTVYGENDGNTAVADHIWENMYAEESNNVIENMVDQVPDQRIDQRERDHSYRFIQIG